MAKDEKVFQRKRDERRRLVRGASPRGGRGESRASEDDALDNLREALELRFQPPLAKALPKIRRVEVEIAAT